MGGKGWESGVSRCKLLYIGWIKSKVLLYSTESYIQYPVIDYGGGEYEKEYVCVAESFCYTTGINTTL